MEQSIPEYILNQEQMEAVMWTEGPLLVLAGAGSGKTRVLTHRIAYLLDYCHIEPWHILAITFTNKAAGEMKERVENLVGNRARMMWVSTFHSMCLRILRSHIDRLGYRRDFSIYDTDDQRTVMRQIFKEKNFDSKLLKERAVLSVIGSAKNEGMSAEEFQRENGRDLRERRIAECYLEYEKRLRQNNALDFDDLLLRTVDLFRQEPEILSEYQERFRYILVDEYQDTNDIQFLLIDLLSERYKNLCVVGDDDQSIYRFRGANVGNILSFEKRFPGAHVVKLEQNYRSTENILETANAVIANNEGRKKKKLWTEKKGGEEVLFREFETAPEEAQFVIEDIRNGKFAYQDIVILYRTNAQSRLFEEQCVAKNLPYQIVGAVNFYQRREIKDILAYMKLVMNGNDEISLLRVINVPKRGIGASSIEKLRSFARANEAPEHPFSMLDACFDAKKAGISGKAEKGIKSFTGLIFSWREKLRASGLLPREGTEGEARRTKEEDTAYFGIRELMTAIRDDSGYYDELLQEGAVEAESRMQNIEELLNKAQDYEENSEQPSLSEFLEELSLLSDLDRTEDSRDRITLMTLHGAKGLEFAKVYLVGMNDGLFPGTLSMGDAEEMEEERRLCYVGITRARESLTMTAARTRMIHGEYQQMLPSRFVKEMPEQWVKKETLYTPKSFRFEDDGLPGRELPAFGGFYPGDGHGSSFRGESFGNRFSSGKAAFGKSFEELLSGKHSALGRSLSRATGSRKSGPGIPACMQKGRELPKLSSLSYREGDRVRHIKFGEGTVSRIQEDKKDYIVTVQFDTAGQKKMLANFAKLSKI